MTRTASIAKIAAPCLIGLLGVALLWADNSHSEARDAEPAGQAAGCASIIAHGGDGKGLKDNGAAFRSAVAAGNVGTLCVYFPAGTYRFSSSPAITLPADTDHSNASVTIRGDGAEISRLEFDADVSGPTIRLNGSQQSFHIRDLSILSGNKSSRAIGLSVIQDNASMPNPAQSDISGVIVRGRDGFAKSDRFIQGISLHRVSNVNVMNSAIVGSPDGAPYASQGTCLYIEGRVDSIPVQINVIASQLNYCRVGLHYGPYLQGVQIVGSNFVGNDTAIYQPAMSNGNDQIAVSASQFNSGRRNIYLNSPIDGVLIFGSDFYLADSGQASIEMPGVQFSITGNSFIQLGKAQSSAIVIGRFMLDSGVITGNIFKNFGTSIFLKEGSSHVNVQSNSYDRIDPAKVRNEGEGDHLGGGSI